MAHERKCTICGKQYEYCPRCKQYENMPTWYLIYDSENCKHLYETVNKFAFNHITKEEAIEELKDIDMTNKNEYPKDIQTVLDQIFEQTEIIKEEILEPIENQEKTKINKKKVNKKKFVNED